MNGLDFAVTAGLVGPVAGLLLLGRTRAAALVSGLTFFVWWDGTPRGIRAAARRAERRAARDKAEWRARG